MKRIWDLVGGPKLLKRLMRVRKHDSSCASCLEWIHAKRGKKIHKTALCFSPGGFPVYVVQDLQRWGNLIFCKSFIIPVGLFSGPVKVVYSKCANFSRVTLFRLSEAKFRHPTLTVGALNCRNPVLQATRSLIKISHRVIFYPSNLPSRFG